MLFVKHDASRYFPNSLFWPLKRRCPYASVYCTNAIFTGFSRSILSKLPLTACFPNSNTNVFCLNTSLNTQTNKSLITRRFKIVPNSNIIQFVLNSTISGKIGTNYALVTSSTFSGLQVIYVLMQCLPSFLAWCTLLALKFTLQPTREWLVSVCTLVTMS